MYANPKKDNDNLKIKWDHQETSAACIRIGGPELSPIGSDWWELTKKQQQQNKCKKKGKAFHPQWDKTQANNKKSRPFDHWKLCEVSL